MQTKESYGYQRSMDTFLKTGGKVFKSPEQALKNKITTGSSNSGPCKACRINQRTGAKMPPLHPHCKCAEVKSKGSVSSELMNSFRK